MNQETLHELRQEALVLDESEQTEIKGGYRIAPHVIRERIAPRWDEIDIRLHNNEDGVAGRSRNRGWLGLRLP